ncbi:hypothetical protein GCM10023083_44130 [Streptomyces phyllanthi]
MTTLVRGTRPGGLSHLQREEISRAWQAVSRSPPVGPSVAAPGPRRRRCSSRAEVTSRSWQRGSVTGRAGSTGKAAAETLVHRTPEGERPSPSAHHPWRYFTFRLQSAMTRVES